MKVMTEKKIFSNTLWWTFYILLPMFRGIFKHTRERETGEGGIGCRWKCGPGRVWIPLGVRPWTTFPPLFCSSEDQLYLDINRLRSLSPRSTYLPPNDVCARLYISKCACLYISVWVCAECAHTLWNEVIYESRCGSGCSLSRSVSVQSALSESLFQLKHAVSMRRGVSSFRNKACGV